MAERRIWWKKYSPEFKRAAVDRLTAGETGTKLALELGIRRKFLYLWRDQGWGSTPFVGTLRRLGAAEQKTPGETPDAERDALRQKIVALERLVGQQTADLDFFAAALRNITAPRPQSAPSPGAASTKPSKP